MNIGIQEKFFKAKCMCEDILQSLASDDVKSAKQKSWLLHEVICTQFGSDYGKEEE